MANQLYTPKGDGESIQFYFVSTKCDIESKKSGKSGKSYNNFIYEVKEPGSDEVKFLPVYEKSDQVLNVINSIKPTPEDLCILTAHKQMRNGYENTTYTLDIPSRGVDVAGSEPYKMTRADREALDEKLGMQWAMEAVLKGHPENLTDICGASKEEEKTAAVGNYAKKVFTLLMLRDKFIQKRSKEKTKP